MHAMFAVNQLMVIWAKKEAYLEATNLLINLNHQLMEELDMIKRWCTLLQEGTENVLSSEIK
jgi:hypothetical protein